MVEIRNLNSEVFPSSVETELADSFTSEHASDQKTLQRILAMCTILKNLSIGRDIIVGRSAHDRLWFCVDGCTSCVIVLAAHSDWFHICCDMPSNEHWLEGVEGNFSVSMLGEKNTAIAIAKTLEHLTEAHVGEKLLKYVNDNAAEPQEIVYELVVCPYCKIEFDPCDNGVWNGRTHLFCGQQLELETTQRSRKTLKEKLRRTLE